MKKIVNVLLIILVCSILTACGGGTIQDKDKVNKENKAEKVTKSNEDYFEWSPMSDTQIVGYTEEGLKQKKIVIPEKCTSVQGLDENEKVESIIFENPDTEILGATFAKCTSLKTIQLPDNLEVIETYAFNGCSALETISIPDSVTEIKDDAFLQCTALKAVSFGKNLQIIGRKAFYECTDLESVKMSDSVTTIEKSAFERCAGLKEVVFGTALQSIGTSAFKECNELKSVKLPEGVTTLDDWTFAYCDALEDIYIPSSVTSIEISSIAQTHEINVYMEQGSYIDQQLENLMGIEFYNRIYQ